MNSFKTSTNIKVIDFYFILLISDPRMVYAFGFQIRHGQGQDDAEAVILPSEKAGHLGSYVLCLCYLYHGVVPFHWGAGNRTKPIFKRKIDF